MRQSGRQTTKSYRIGRVLTKSPLKKPDRLVEAAKLDQGITDASKIIMNGGAQRVTRMARSQLRIASSYWPATW